MDGSRALGAVLDLATAALFSPSGADPLIAVLPELRSAVGADAVGYFEHVHGGLTTTVLVYPEDIWARLPFTRTSTEFAAHVHPGIRYLIAGAPTSPFAVTDLISEREWRNSELGSLMRPDWGQNHQLMLPVRPPAGTAQSNVFVLGRSDRGFSTDDRAVGRQLIRILNVVTAVRATGSSRWTAAALGQLTQRERLMLTLTTAGHSAPNIGAQLGISPRTVHKHLEHAYRKLGIHDRHEAATLMHGATSHADLGVSR